MQAFHSIVGIEIYVVCARSLFKETISDLTLWYEQYEEILIHIQVETTRLLKIISLFHIDGKVILQCIEIGINLSIVLVSGTIYCY